MFPPMAQSKTLLIVDDDTDLREALAEQLQLDEQQGRAYRSLNILDRVG